MISMNAHARTIDNIVSVTLYLQNPDCPLMNVVIPAVSDSTQCFSVADQLGILAHQLSVRFNDER